MSDNVIIFGAGASADAGIPLMSNFIEKMWEMSIRGKLRSDTLTAEDQALLSEAMAIKDELDSYHGRAHFNDRNIEDVLSILSFDAMIGGRTHRKRLSTFVNAISRTIELTCVLRDRGIGGPRNVCPAQYIGLWTSLSYRIRSLPTIITFNYDLVLERSLYSYCAMLEPAQLSFNCLSIVYHYAKLPCVTLSTVARRFQHANAGDRVGTWLEIAANDKPASIEVPASIEILKLHGSVNFPRMSQANQSLPILPADNPLIMPPVFSKMEYSTGLDEAWKKALQRLRKAKHVIIVGYSLPITDIYMQYFLKAGLGPNRNLNRVFVFDPVLFKKDERCEAMEQRYRTCFSPQMQDRIIFRPPGSGTGDLQHFVDNLNAVLF